MIKKLTKVIKKSFTKKGKEEIRDAFIQRTTLKLARILDGWIPYGPGIIALEPTNRCNLRCKICPRTYWNSSIPVGDISREIFNKVVPYFSKRVTVSLQMFGEPFFAPNFFDMLHIAKKYSLEIVLNTNGTLLTQETCNKLVKEGLDLLAISIDGIKTLPEIRGINIETIKKNIENLNQAKKTLGSNKPCLAIAFVGMRRNVEELPDMIQFAKAYNFKGIQVVHLVVHSKELLNENLLYHKELAHHYFKLAKEKADKLDIELSLPPLEEKQLNNSICTQPFVSLWISWDGTVRPCCASNFHEKGAIVLGNVNTSSLKKIWNNERMRILRKELLGILPLNDYCKRCPILQVKKENFIRIL